MSNARNLADLLNASGKIKSSKLDAASVANDSLDSQHYAAASIDLEHLSSQSVDEDNLYVSNAGANGQYLQKQSGNAGGLTWGTVDLTTLSGANLTSGIIPTARINASSIANDLLDSQHYAAGSIDTEHLAADSVTTAKIADSVALGGSPKTTTQYATDNSTKVATTAYADAAVAALADSAPSTLNTLNELAAALGDDANYATTTATAIGTKMPLAGGAFTGAVTTNSTFDGRDVAADGVTADAALPKAGGTMTGDTLHGDNVKSKYGTSGDLEVFHDSGNSRIKDVGTGSLIISGSLIYFNNAASNQSMISATEGGAAKLYYAGAQKLASSAAGVTVTGTMSTGKVLLTDNGNSTIAGLQLGNQGIGLSVPTTDTMHLLTADQTRMTINAAGSVGINTASPSSGYMLHVGGSSGVHTKVKIEATTATGQAELDLTADPAGVSYLNLGDENSYNIGQLGYFHSDNSMRFRVNAAERMRINSAGEVLIGTTTQGRETDLAVVGTDQSPTGAWSQLGIYSNDSYAINKGGSMMFGGQDGLNVRSWFAGIKGAKENSTNQNYAGYLAFYTRPSGSTPEERMRITSDGRGLSDFTAKAWVNFNGVGTVSIRDSHNVSSITDINVGNYVVNLSNFVANNTYAVSLSNNYVANNGYVNTVLNLNTGSFGMYLIKPLVGHADTAINTAIVFAS